MNSCDLLWQGRVITVVVEISAFSVHVHPLFDLMFVVSSIPRLHTAANRISEIIEFPWEWNLIKNGGSDADEAGTSLTSAILFWWEAVHTNEQQESINGRSTGSPYMSNTLDLSRVVFTRRRIESDRDRNRNWVHGA